MEVKVEFEELDQSFTTEFADVVKIVPIITDKTITENGTYKAKDDNADGYGEVVVNILQGVFPNGTLDVTKNGTYNVSEYENVDVSVDLPPEAYLLTGNCTRRFYANGWNWFLEEYGDKMSTVDITSAEAMFSTSSELTHIPFDINLVVGGGNVSGLFSSCSKLVNSPKVNCNCTTTQRSANQMYMRCEELVDAGTVSNLYPSTTANMFNYCEKMRFLPKMENWNLSYIQTKPSASAYGMFEGCHSLRQIPEDILKQFYGVWTSPNYCFLYQAFSSCYALDELRGLRGSDGILTSNVFGNTFAQCFRLKDIIFDTDENGLPRVASWKSQTIDLTRQVGYSDNYSILWTDDTLTTATQITNADTYQALKDNPNSWTKNIKYSRYNHDSAVNTINSLPDTSQYLATAGGTNTIKFKGAAGSGTDGGAINTLTEEEIAVAAAKGWTVTLV